MFECFLEFQFFQKCPISKLGSYTTSRTSSSTHCLPAVLVTVVFRLMAFIMCFTYLNVWTFAVMSLLTIATVTCQLKECSYKTRYSHLSKRPSDLKQNGTQLINIVFWPSFIESFMWCDPFYMSFWVPFRF